MRISPTRLRTTASLLAGALLSSLGCGATIAVPGPDPAGDKSPVHGALPDLGVAARGSPDLAQQPPPRTPEDDATIVDAQLPATLDCAGTFMATVTAHNTGTATWTRAAGYKLGAVGDNDPFHQPEPRVWLPDDVSVPPGSEHIFTIPLVAPAQAGSYTTEWQMVREGVRWFGATTTQKITVACARPFDLSQATIFNSPMDVANWPETAKVTVLDLNARGVFIDFTKKDGQGSWPDVPFGMPGDSLEYTLWIAINVNGKWYTSGCIEYWRGLDRNGGPPSGYAMNWYYDANRWHTMTGHQPAVGEKVGFFVTAGDARNNGNAIVKERSNVVFIPFPDDNGAKFVY